MDNIKQYFKKKIKHDTKIMGVDIDKNEYREIVLSNSNKPENMHGSKEER